MTPRPTAPPPPLTGLKANARGIAWYTVLIGLSLIFVAPLVWMLLTSIKGPGEATQVPPTVVPQDPTTTAWVTDLPWAWISLVGVTVWWTAGFNAVIYLAGLQDISPELYEAAKIDGAGKWAEFRHVTLPGLRPVLLFVVIITILLSSNMFGQSYLITQGAPGNETRTAIMYIAQEGLRDYRMGSAAAMSYVLTLALLLVSVITFRVFRTKD